MLLALAGWCLGLASSGAATPASPPRWLAPAVAALETDLVKQYGETQRARLRRGLAQSATFWGEADGTAAEFADFVRQNFAGNPATLDALFQRFEAHLEALDGHLTEINHAFRREMDLDLGPVLPLDEIFGGYDPFAHVSEDFFRNKLAFVVLLNFPLTTLEERRTEGRGWTRRQWAEARLAQRFSKRVPAEANQAVAQAAAAAELYISGYKIWMHHVLDASGSRPFPPKQRLIAHWNLRDEIKAQYSDAVHGLARQLLTIAQNPRERTLAGAAPPG